jgi:hypothetical protein
VVRMSLAVLVLSLISGCAGEPQKPEASLASQTQANPWAATVTPVAADAKGATPETREENDCLRSSSIMALWSCEKGTNSH